MTILGFVPIEWAAFCDWVQGKLIKDTRPIDEGRVWLMFTDGTEAVVASDYDYGYSPETPGEGVLPPMVSVWGERKCDGCGETVNFSAEGRDARASKVPVRSTCPRCGKGKWITADKP
jgi:hypothetical protein